jgi:hypothetical protein
MLSNILISEPPTVQIGTNTANGGERRRSSHKGVLSVNVLFARERLTTARG